MHLPDHVYEADAVALGTDEGADDAEVDGESVVDAGGGAGACGGAGDVPPGDVDDGDDADATPHGGGWSSGSSASTSNTDKECPHDARTCSSESATSQSDECSDGSTPVTDSDEEYESEDDSPAGDSPDEDNRPNVNTVFLQSLRVQAPVEVHGEMDYGASLSGRVLEWYHSLQDEDRAEPVFSGRDDTGDLPRFDALLAVCVHVRVHRQRGRAWPSTNQRLLHRSACR